MFALLVLLVQLLLQEVQQVHPAQHAVKVHIRYLVTHHAQTVLLVLMVPQQAYKLLLAQAIVLLANILLLALLPARIVPRAQSQLLQAQGLVHLVPQVVLTRKMLAKQHVIHAQLVAQALDMEQSLRHVLQQQTQSVVLQLLLRLQAQHLQSLVQPLLL